MYLKIIDEIEKGNISLLQSEDDLYLVIYSADGEINIKVTEDCINDFAKNIVQQRLYEIKKQKEHKHKWFECPNCKKVYELDD